MGREACWRAANCCWTSGTVRKYTVLAVVPDNSKYATAATMTVIPIATFTWCGDMLSPFCYSCAFDRGLAHRSSIAPSPLPSSVEGEGVCLYRFSHRLLDQRSRDRSP